MLDSAPRRSRPLDDDELSALLLRVADGDADAFAELYDQTSPRLFGLILRIVRGGDRAAEVAHEVYLQVWRQPERFEPGRGTAWSWLTALAHRQAIHHLRTQPPWPLNADGATGPDSVPVAAEVGALVPQTADALAVQAAVLRLPPQQREVLRLAYFEGRTAADIADQLDIAVETVQTWITGGLTGLRRELVTT